jgi:hypothetical protein
MTEQRFDRSDVFRRFKIGREGLFIAVDGMKERRIAVERKIGDVELPAEIANLWALDLDDAGSQVCKAQACGGSGKKLRKINNQKAFQWFH